MSEGYELEPFHVPQQSRRDKLRESSSASINPSPLQLHVPPSAPLLPLYHPSFIKDESFNFIATASSATSSITSSSSSQLLYDLSHSLNPHQPLHPPPFFYPSHLPPTFKDDAAAAFDDSASPSSFDPSLLAFKPPNPLACTTPQGLSLSLSSHCRTSSSSPASASAAAQPHHAAVSTVPIGPFTGYAAILKGSRFLKPAQQLLEEFCDVGRRIYADRSAGEPSSAPAPDMDSLSDAGIVDDAHVSFSSGGGERRRMKARLISMLNEVYRRYKHYYQQLQAVVTSFEAVAGLSTAAPYTCFAISAMSKHFRCLKNAITDQIHSTSKAFNEESFGKEESKSFGLVDQGLRQPKLAHNLSILEQPHVWRPQRGLPERAVAVLRAWLFEHFLHPYPTDADKQMLAKQTGLSRNQVSNWFINARVRLWKPMVEEIHTLEMRQAQKAPSEGDNTNSNQQCKVSLAEGLPVDKQPQDPIIQKNQDPSRLKRYRNELAQITDSCDEPVMNFSYDNVGNHHGVGIGLPSGNNGISLTLGLRQNNGVGLSEPLPMSVAQFGLEDNNSPYVIGGFDSQNRRYGRDIGGQLLRDFVG